MPKKTYKCWSDDIGLEEEDAMTIDAMNAGHAAEIFCERMREGELDDFETSNVFVVDDGEMKVFSCRERVNYYATEIKKGGV